MLDESSRVALLTPREKEVLALLAKGLSVKEIATALSISPRTAGAHLTNLYEKPKVHNAISATRMAIRCGLASA